MPSTYSTNLKIELQANGENSTTWGTITNTNLGTALEQAIVGYGNPSFSSDANLTLSYTDTNAAQAARALVLNVTSAVSLSTTRELVVPTIQKQYIVQNNTSGSQSITVKTAAGSGVTVPNGRKAHLYVNGTDVIYMDDYVDINGGSIDGTTIGGSSAAAGTFTTLGATTGNITTVNATTVDTTNIEVTNIKAKDGTSAATIADSTGVISLTANPTLSGGTANGVLYLNGSKVATSGSALTFDGTIFRSTQLNIGTAPNANSRPWALNGFGYISGASGNGIEMFNSSTSTYGYWTFESDNRFSFNAIGGHSWTAGGAEKMRVTGTVFSTDSSINVGIGTASPSYKLDVRGSGSIVSWSDGTTPGVLYSTGGYVGLTFPAQSGGFFINPTGNFCTISTSGIERVRIDSSGNLGLGVTPSAWSTNLSIRAMQFGGGSVYSYNNDRILIGQNIAVTGTGTDTYVNTAAASTYRQYQGQHNWYSATSGGAGTNVSFGDPKMTLDASGNLLVGTTSSSGKLTVVGGSNVAGFFSSSSGTTQQAIVTFSNATNSGYLSIAGVGTSSAVPTWTDGSLVSEAVPYSTGNYIISAYSGAITFQTNSRIERGRFTSGGNFLVGDTTSRSVLTKTIELSGAGTGTGQSGFFVNQYVPAGSSTNTGYLTFQRSGSGTLGTNSIVASGDRLGMVRFSGANGTDYTAAAEVYGEVDGTPGASNDMPGRLIFATTSDGSGGTTERARIDASGNLLLGGTSTAQLDGVFGQIIGSSSKTSAGIALETSAGAYMMYTDSTDSLIFWDSASNAERGRFTSGGYFKASNTGTYLGSTSDYHEFRSNITVANGVLFAHATSASATSDGIIQSRASTNTTNNTFYFLSCYNDASTAYKFRIADSGNATNTNNSYGAISDEKMKQDVIDAASQWDDIKGLRVRKFRYKADPTGPVQIGLVAQEAETVSPGLVDEHIDRDAEGNDLGTTTKSVKYSILYMKAVKALQEAMARIESLEADMAALKGAK